MREIDDLRSALAAAEARERNLRDQLDETVHELRTPLTVISGYLAMFAEGTLGPVPDGWRRPLGVVAVKAEEARQLVDDMLTAARMEGNNHPTRAECVDLCEVAGAAVRRAQGQAGLLSGEVRLAPPEVSPLPVSGDVHHIERVVDNLINNGLRHGASPVEVRVVGGDQPCLLVCDQGEGIAASDRDRVFGRFERGGDNAPRVGSGLGLNIARRLAEAMGGTLTLEETALGACFALRLPAWDAVRT